jgi:hypothetical protein
MVTGSLATSLYATPRVTRDIDLVVELDSLTVDRLAESLATASTLLWMRESGSEIQRRDIESILFSVEDLDREYVEHWAAELDVLSAWREVSDASR